jgi:hypothetical protein
MGMRCRDGTVGGRVFDVDPHLLTFTTMLQPLLLVVFIAVCAFLVWAVCQLLAIWVWLCFGTIWPAWSVPRTELAPSLPAGVEGDGLGQPALEEGEAEFREVPVSAHLCARPRRRAVWVRRLERVLGVAPGCVGRFVRGRWTPDLPAPEFTLAANLTLSHLEDGAKILGGGSVSCGENGRVVYYVLELSDGSRELVAPELFSSLATYAFLRERSAVLVSALRLRALEWCRQQGLSKTHTWAFVPSAFRYAWQVGVTEERIRDTLAGGPSPPLWWGSA